MKVVDRGGISGYNVETHEYFISIMIKKWRGDIRNVSQIQASQPVCQLRVYTTKISHKP